MLEASDYAISIRSDFTTAINQFNSVGDVTYLSRANGFANYTAATAGPASCEMSAVAQAAYLGNTAPSAAAVFASPARWYMETLDFFAQDYLHCVIAWMPKNSIFCRHHRTKCDDGGLVAKATKPNRIQIY